MASVRSTPPRLTRNALKRFWGLVDQNGPQIVEALGPCWVWTGGRFASGYGRFNTGNRTLLAHRFSWWLRFGTWPDLLVLHQCDNKECVNPNHLFVGTNADNSADMVRKGRSLSGGRNPAHLHPERCLRGEQIHRARLTAEAVRDIRARHAAGESLVAIRRRFGVTKGAIYAVVHRRTWRHIQ